MPSTPNDNQQMNTPTDNSGLGGNGAGIGGYVSPYTHSTSQPATPAPTPNAPQPQPIQQSVAPATQPMPNIQDYMNQTMPSPTPAPIQTQQAPVSNAPTMQVSSTPTAATSAPTNNILDNPLEVEQILREGQSTPREAVAPPVQQPVQNNEPIPNSDLPALQHFEEPKEVSIPAPTQASIPEPINAPEPKPIIQEKAEEPQEQVVPTVSAIRPEGIAKKLDEVAAPLNPKEDLKNFSPKDMQGNSLDRKYTNITDLLEIVVQKKASDLHLTVDYPPFIRIDDKLVPMGAPLSKEEVRNLISQSLTQNQKELLEVNREVDLSYQYQEKGRFRINAYYERGNLAAAFRLIPQHIRTITELGLPGILLDFTRLSQGLILVTGPTGSGKSTTLSGMIQSINESTPKHILTIEDPIEYVYPKATALVDQRELGNDTHDWTIAMKSALRQDPDVILIGELRDFETIQLAITLAETGHLVFATLHTNSCAQSIDRIIDVFPPHQQQQIKTQLAGVLKGIMSQRLVPLIGGGRQAVIELMLVTPAVQNLIREGKTYQIDNVISTSADIGMTSLEKSLVKLVRQGKITTSTAQDYAIRPEEILKLMKSNQI
jgi:twitching motility protein PilT